MIKKGNFDRWEHDGFLVHGLHLSHDVNKSDFDLHTHDFYEASIVVSGCARHKIGSYSYPIRRGNMYVIKPGIAHGFYDVDNLEIIDIMYFPELFTLADRQIFSLPGFSALFIVEPDIRLNNFYPYLLTLTDADINYVVVTADFIIQESQKKTLGHTIVIKHFMLSLFAFLSVKYAEKVEEPHVAQLLSQAVRYMYENMAAIVKISDIAEHLYISARHLNRLFRQFYNSTPGDFLLDIRLKHAMTLLVKHQLKVSEVSAQCGFADPSYFARVFKKVYGIRPHQAKGGVGN